MSPDRAMRDRFLEFERGLDRLVCDRCVEYGWGTAYLCPTLPAVRDMSWIAVERVGLGPEAVEALGEEALGGAGFAHRTVVPCDEDDGRRLAAEFARRPGWEVERVQYMTWRSSFAGHLKNKKRTPKGALGVREATLAEILPLRRRLQDELLRDGGGERDAVLDQLLEMDRRFGAAAGDRWLVAPAEGAPAAACRLLARGGVTQIEEVATLIAHRGRGLGTAVVRAALDEARAAAPQAIFLTADAEDWPRLLYERLGFEAVGDIHVLLRRS